MNNTTGSVIPFPTPKPGTVSQDQYKAELQKERSIRAEKAGGKALENLKGWRTNIPKEDRLQMALNMHSNVFERYQLKLEDLKPFAWKDYPDEAGLRRDLSRVRIKSPLSSSNKRLIAHTPGWIRILEYARHALKENGTDLSLEILAGKLSIGTRYHPIQRAKGETNKLRLLLTTIADKASEEAGLLSSYRDISNARIRYLQRYGHEIHMPEIQLTPTRCLADSFEPLDDFGNLFTKTFLKYDSNDWKMALDIFPREYHSLLNFERENVESWQRMNNPNTSLVEDFGDHHSAALCSEIDLFYLPRYFIGFNLWCADSRILTTNSELHDCIKDDVLKRPNDFCIEYLKEHSTQKYAFQESELHLNSCYLVLYPDENLNSVIPYIYRYSEEGSHFAPYEEEPYDGEFFAAEIKKNEAVRGYTLLERLEEDKENVLAELLNTAPKIKSHPYIEWETQKSQSIDNFLNDLLK